MAFALRLELADGTPADARFRRLERAGGATSRNRVRFAAGPIHETDLASGASGVVARERPASGPTTACLGLRGAPAG